MNCDDIKVIRTISHLENDFHKTISDAKWFRRRRREKKRKLEEQRRNLTKTKPVELVPLLSDDDEVTVVSVPEVEVRDFEIVELDEAEEKIIEDTVPSQGHASTNEYLGIANESDNQQPAVEKEDGVGVARKKVDCFDIGLLKSESNAASSLAVPSTPERNFDEFTATEAHQVQDMESATELSTLDLEVENPGVGATEKDIRLNEAEQHPSSLAPCVSPLKCGDQSILHTCDQQHLNGKQKRRWRRLKKNKGKTKDQIGKLRSVFECPFYTNTKRKTPVPSFKKLKLANHVAELTSISTEEVTNVSRDSGFVAADSLISFDQVDKEISTLTSEYDGMPSLRPQMVYEQIKMLYGVDIEEDSDVDEEMPILIVQTCVGDSNTYDETEEIVHSSVEGEADEDELEVQEQVTKILMSNRKARVRVGLKKDNGLVIVELEEAATVFENQCCWCKLCDTFFAGIKTLRNHILIIHGINADRVTKHNEATWDLPVANTPVNPLDLDQDG